MMHFTSVDLPAPFSPRSACTLPGVNVERDVLQRGEGAEALGQPGAGEAHGAGWSRQGRAALMMVSLSRAARDDGDGTAAVRALMLGAAGHEELGMADDAGEHAADEGAGMAGGGDVAVVEHGVAAAAHGPPRAASALASSADHAAR